MSKGLRQVQQVTKTLSGLMRNIIHEQKKSRDEMLRIMGISEAGEASLRRFGTMEFDREREAEEEERKGEDSTDNECIEFNEEEENEIFHDAQEEIVKIEEQKAETSKFNILDIPQERVTLPHLRNPNTKVGFFQLLRDVIGKDLSRVSLPVYFNEPLAMT